MKQLDTAVAQAPLKSDDEVSLRLPKDARQDLVRLSDDQLYLVGGGDDFICW